MWNISRNQNIFAKFLVYKFPELTFLTRYIHKSRMAKSRYEYVKEFESSDQILPNCWIVVRVDGKSFHKFTETHKYEKPNDVRGLNLMSNAAADVMKEFNEIVLAYGQSDEYSFIFHRSTKVYNRRAAKILSNVNSLFSSSFVFNWRRWFGDEVMKYPPSFDARIVLYPTDENLRDYLSWRQADVHVNNLYNTCFWKLILEKGMTTTQADERLKGTVSADKNELLFQDFGINYNNLPAMFRKGTILLNKKVKIDDQLRNMVIPLHVDLIKEKFWKEHDEILLRKSIKSFEFPNQEIPELTKRMTMLQTE